MALEIAGQVVVLEQDAVLQGLVPALDLALGLRVIRRSADVLHTVFFKPVGQIACNIRGAIIA